MVIMLGITPILGIQQPNFRSDQISAPTQRSTRVYHDHRIARVSYFDYL